ncbi:MAG: porphobilinogen synthase [Alphaproteobacteria bacterium]|nr:MAG: porphobilinogen synthase [Alphaproteobacteria bacterium]
MQPFPGRFPTTRLRRLRRSGWSRALVAESELAVTDLIWPIFVTPGEADEDIPSMPGVRRHALSSLPAVAETASGLGIPLIAVFPYTAKEDRTPRGEEALNPDNLVCRAIRALKRAAPEVGVMADVALDPYTSHGQDGILDERGEIVNDETVAVLVEQALVEAGAGADIVAPSDMMDGRIGAIRRALDEAGFAHVQIMSYAAKYASCFYGPFRDAVGSRGVLKGDKKTYQMDPANAREALREVELDLAEGADSLIVKPGLPYLDVLWRVKEAFGVPTFAYQVSGEYAMIAEAAAKGAFDLDAAVLESLLCFKRAGADGVLTYFAPRAARLLRDK